MSELADRAERLLETTASAVWDLDDFDYNGYDHVIQRPFELGKPYLDNDSRYRLMAAEASAITLETLASEAESSAGEKARAERYRQLAGEMRKQARYPWG